MIRNIAALVVLSVFPLTGCLCGHPTVTSSDRNMDAVKDDDAPGTATLLKYQADFTFADAAGYVLPVGAEIIACPSVGTSVFRYMSGVTWHSEWSNDGPVGYWDFADVTETTRFSDGAPEEYREVCDSVVKRLDEGLKNGGWRVAGNAAMSDGWHPSRISALVTLQFRLQNPPAGQAYNNGVDTHGSVALITYHTDISLDGTQSDEMTLRVAVLSNIDASRVFELTAEDTERLVVELNRLRLAATKGR